MTVCTVMYTFVTVVWDLCFSGYCFICHLEPLWKIYCIWLWAQICKAAVNVSHETKMIPLKANELVDCVVLCDPHSLTPVWIPYGCLSSDCCVLTMWVPNGATVQENEYNHSTEGSYLTWWPYYTQPWLLSYSMELRPGWHSQKSLESDHFFQCFSVVRV